VSRVPLRRADWRFLLPAPPEGAYRHLVLLGGPDELGDRLLEVGFARRVSRRLGGPRSADLVVVLHDARVDLVAAARTVAEGGAFYVEVDRRSAGSLMLSPARAGRLLRSAGLTTLGVHWVIPGFSNTRRYIPLDSPAALRWYLDTLHTSGSAMGLLAGVAVAALTWGDSTRLAHVAPCFGISAAAEAAPRPPSVLGCPGVPFRLRPSGVRLVMLTSGLDDGSRVVLLPFISGGHAPAAVVKVSRVPAFNGNTEREQATLVELRAGLDDALRPSIPEPLGTFRYGDLVVGMESCAPGAALVVTSGRLGGSLSRAVGDLDEAAAWLARFHQQLRQPGARWDDASQDRLGARLDRFVERFGDTHGVARLFELTRGRARELLGRELPVARLHNDFGPWNVHRNGARVTVIDWEYGESARDRQGPALCDLLYFVTEWTLRVRHLREPEDERRGFRELFVAPRPGEAASEAGRRAIATYMTRLEMDTRFLPLLLVQTWVERALERGERNALSAEPAGTIPDAGRYADYVRLLAGGADGLFGAVQAG
jgi:hypothetical protein